MDIDSVPFEYIDRVLSVIEQTPQHIYLILTKRPLRMQRYFCEYRKDYHPLPNVILGVTVENQEHTDRIDILRQTPAAARWVSFEPLLEDVGKLNLEGISWCVVGSESGRNARPFNLDWARAVRDQCVEAGVPFYLKQVQAINMKGIIHAPTLDGRQWLEVPW